MSVVHGGRLDEAIARYGGKAARWLDLSTGINAKPYPLPKFEPAIWQRLPSRPELAQLLDVARKYYGAAAGSPCAAAAGIQTHIQILPFLFKPQSVAIVGFTYQEHGVCWQRAGHEVLVADGLESAESSARIVIVVNPNNPDGQQYDPEELAVLARRLGAKGGLLVVDESYCDVQVELTTLAHAGQPGLLVLRSFGKFFGLAGVRLGFAFGAEILIEKIIDHLGPWPVAGPALVIGSKALADRAWIRRSRKRLARDRPALVELLETAGLSIVGGCDLFVLARHPRAARLYEYLASQQILVRRFPGRDDWLRFGVPALNGARRRLLNGLTGFEQ